ncbi:protein YpmT [Bacillus atrophaeus]|uniref:protein YpmT n=1 Tax=Bacillus atrophaeus TaxID=1452 RepID=UPI000261A16E|nr:protein YpmT [Bacillus atrophaeus]EIM11866.1 hypothetical protein UY9_04657 [Bacillus atrophaeus C89]
MKRIYQYCSLLACVFSFYFGWLAYLHLAREDIDQMYLNIAYCALFLSVTGFSFDVKDRKKTDKS